MVPYLIIFIISILVCAAGEWALRRNRAGGLLLCCVSAAFPVFLAGAREYTVGTDIATYGNYVFKAACNARSLFACVRAQREIDPLLKIRDAYPKMILARTRQEAYQYEGVQIVDVADWLANASRNNSISHF